MWRRRRRRFPSAPPRPAPAPRCAIGHRQVRKHHRRCERDRGDSASLIRRPPPDVPLTRAPPSFCLEPRARPITPSCRPVDGPDIRRQRPSGSGRYAPRGSPNPTRAKPRPLDRETRVAHGRQVVRPDRWLARWRRCPFSPTRRLLDTDLAAAIRQAARTNVATAYFPLPEITSRAGRCRGS